IIQQLEETLTETRAMKQEQEQSVREAETLRAKYEAEAKELREKKQDIVSEARAQARIILKDANSQIENTLREIRGGASNERIREMRQVIEESRQSVAKDEELEKAAANQGNANGFTKGD